MAVFASMPERRSWRFAPANPGVARRGSSDKPRTGRWSKTAERNNSPDPELLHKPLPGPMLRHKPLLTETLQGSGMIVYKSSGAVDNEATNARRVDYAIQNGLAPVIGDAAVPLFRVIQNREGGLMTIGYSLQMPKKLAALSSDEAIAIPLAAVYLRVEKNVIETMIRNGVVRGNSNTANLADLNQVREDGTRRIERFQMRIDMRDALQLGALRFPSP